MFTTLVELLPESMQPRAKAFFAGGGSAVLTLVLVGLFTHQWDTAAILSVLVGAPTGLSVSATPNLPVAPKELVEYPADFGPKAINDD